MVDHTTNHLKSGSKTNKGNKENTKANKIMKIENAKKNFSKANNILNFFYAIYFCVFYSSVIAHTFNHILHSCGLFNIVVIKYVLSKEALFVDHILSLLLASVNIYIRFLNRLLIYKSKHKNIFYSTSHQCLTFLQAIHPGYLSFFPYGHRAFSFSL